MSVSVCVYKRVCVNGDSEIYQRIHSKRKDEEKAEKGSKCVCENAFSLAHEPTCVSDGSKR